MAPPAVRHGSTASAEGVSYSLQFDYTTVGHVTVDVLPDGTSRAGGTALYSALQAARLGLRTLIHTRGVPHEIESLLQEFSDEVALRIEPADATTTLLTSGQGSTRRQRVLAWAGPIEAGGPLESSILHLAPIAREIAEPWHRHDGFLGLTPQGLVRGWSGPRAELLPCAPEPFAAGLAKRCDAIVISELERPACSELIAAAQQEGCLVAITAGSEPTRLLAAGAAEQELAVNTLERPVDDIGAGDVYACALFIALSEGATPTRAAAFASASAAERMTGAGPQAIAGREAILARLDHS
jgi:sugar/nucleoside kinase (ribokinase family)